MPDLELEELEEYVQRLEEECPSVDVDALDVGGGPPGPEPTAGGARAGPCAGGDIAIDDASADHDVDRVSRRVQASSHSGICLRRRQARLAMDACMAA